MKRLTSVLALFVASLFITAGVWAQAVKANVPFDFTINNTTVPAGTYTISSTSSDVLRIYSDQKHVHLLTTALMDQSNAGKANVLVFHKYGNQYFLSEIRCKDSSSMNLRLPVWNAEKRARTAQTQEAGIPLSSDVLVALN
jgi:hypothetical protein